MDPATLPRKGGPDGPRTATHPRVTGLYPAASPRLGPWRLDPETRVPYPVWPYRYEVNLDRCTTSAAMLDWIIQIARKGWASPNPDGSEDPPGYNPDGWTEDAILAGLVRALDDVLHPQAHLCSFGTSSRFSRWRIAELVAKAARVERGRGR